MNNNEVLQARDALQAWFMSQDIVPADAAIIMASLVAKLFVQKARDLGYLQESIALNRQVLALQVAQELRR